jgi:hypothetical protein
MIMFTRSQAAADQLCSLSPLRGQIHRGPLQTTIHFPADALIRMKYQCHSCVECRLTKNDLVTGIRAKSKHLPIQHKSHQHICHHRTNTLSLSPCSLCASGPPFPGRLVLWSPGPLVPWSSGPLVLWSPGLLVLWSSGPLVLWSLGPLVPWSLGPLVPWSLGLLVL